MKRPFTLWIYVRYLLRLKCRRSIVKEDKICPMAEMDTFAIMLTFESGAVANFVTYAHAGWSFPFEAIEVYGKYSTVSTQELEKVTYSLGLNQPSRTSDFYQLSVEDKWGYAEEDRLFIDAIVEGTKPPVTAEDGFLSIRLLEAVYESARTGQRIDFRDGDHE